MKHPQDIHDLYALRTTIHLPATLVATTVGVCLQTYRNWEQGKTNPCRDHRRRLARVLRTTEAYLCRREEL